MMEVSEKGAAKLAAELIQLSLEDLTGWPYDTEAKDANAWFKERGQGGFEYGWCLCHSKANPNLIRKAIEWKKSNPGRSFGDYRKEMLGQMRRVRRPPREGGGS